MENVMEKLRLKNRRNDIVCLVAIVMFFIIKFFMPPVNGLTQAGADMLSVFIPCVILWIFVATDWPCIAGICALIALDIVPVGTALSIGFGTVNTWLTVAFIFCSIAMQESGILEKVAKWLVSRKIVDGKPWIFLAVFISGIMFFGLWVSQTVTILLFSTIAAAVCKSVNIEKGEKMYTAIMLCVLWTAITAEGVIPYGKIVGMTVMSIMEGFGIPFVLQNYLKMSIPFALLYIVCALLIFRFVLNPEVEKFKNYNGEAYRNELKATKLTRKEIFSVIIYIAMMLSILAPSFTFLPGVSAWFTKNGSAWGPLVCMMLMAVIRIDGQPMVPLAKGWSQVPWQALIFMAGALVFSATMGSKDLGITTMFTNILSSAFSGSAGIFVVATLAFGMALLMTNFLSNTVTAAVCTSAFLPMLITAYQNGTSTLNPWSVAGAIILVSSVSYLTPAASVMVPFILGPHVSIKDGLKPNLSQIIGSFVIILVVVFAIGY
jgi:sodium-dependent dicarboxylate transporter 2/3/5